MALESLECPVCNYARVAQVSDNKYRCLDPRCGHEFIYQPVNKTINRNEHLVEDKAIYNCSVCGGKFHVLQRPAYMCGQCGENYICADCHGDNKICRNCQAQVRDRNKIDLSAGKWNRFLLGLWICLVVGAAVYIFFEAIELTGNITAAIASALAVVVIAIIITTVKPS